MATTSGASLYVYICWAWPLPVPNKGLSESPYVILVISGILGRGVNKETRSGHKSLANVIHGSTMPKHFGVGAEHLFVDFEASLHTATEAHSATQLPRPQNNRPCLFLVKNDGKRSLVGGFNPSKKN